MEALASPRVHEQEARAQLQPRVRWETLNDAAGLGGAAAAAGAAAASAGQHAVAVALGGTATVPGRWRVVWSCFRSWLAHRGLEKMAPSAEPEDCRAASHWALSDYCAPPTVRPLPSAQRSHGDLRDSPSRPRS